MAALGLALAVACMLLLTEPNIGLVLAGMVLAGFVGPWVFVAAVTAIQRRTPAGLAGRVSGAFQLSLTVPQVTSVGLGAVLIAVVSYRVLLVVIAVVTAAAVAFLVSQPRARQRLAPAATPEAGTAEAAGPETA